MDKITLTETEVAYIIHILSQYLYIEEVRKICYILISHFPLEHSEQT